MASFAIVMFCFFFSLKAPANEETMCRNIVRLNFSLLDISEYIFSDILFLYASLSLLMLTLGSTESGRAWNLVNIVSRRAFGLN